MSAFVAGGVDDDDGEPGTLVDPVPPAPVTLDESEARAGRPGASDDTERYRPTRRLGQGSMGEVLLCRDERIGREVAMKVMQPDHRHDDHARRRFVREARIQGQLEHPSIVPVHDLGAAPDGAAWFTMKCVRGSTLRQVINGLRRGEAPVIAAWSRRKLLTAFSSLCLAVDFAHARGVVHRDLKPSNVMLGDFGEVYLLDWGIAKVREADDVEGDQMTRAGARPGEGDAAPPPTDDELETAVGRVLGTLGYMAPEQARGAEVDARSDVYSLGAMLFELLALVPLHPKGDWRSTLRSTLDGADARPSVRAPEREVAPELEAICVRATAARPAARFASARELHAAIERFLDGARDVELRRQMAERHATAMTAAAERALAGGPEAERARREALREVGQVLALEPTNVEALRTLRRVITEPPRKVPGEVRTEMEDHWRSRERLLLSFGIRAELIGIVLTVLGALWMGLRDAPTLAAAVLFTAASSTVKWRALHIDHRHRFFQYVYTSYLLNLCALECSGRSFGPLLFIPLPLAVMTCAYCIAYAPGYRRAVLATGCLAFFVPIALEGFGVLQQSYRFSPDGMTIFPHLVSMPPVATMVALVTGALFMTVAPGIMITRLLRALEAAQQQAFLQSWHLRQLLP